MIYFASYRELTGIAKEEVELSEISTVGALIETVQSLHGPMKDVRRMLVAVNGEFTEPGVALRDGDVVALFPPVSGG